LTKVGTGAKLEDSNISAYGSKEHKDAKLASAKTEKAWDGAGKAEGVQIWRIEKFKVKHVDKANYGSFFNGDSYIVLNTYKPDPSSAKLAYNVHFWLGKNTSQDEAGTAAYKTVELDDLLGDVPVQYREVEGFESDEFLKVFKGCIKIMEGGVASGFNIIKPEEYKARLLHIKGTKIVHVKEVPCEVKSLNKGDAFVLDLGMEIIQWNGPTAGMFEKRKGQEVITGLKDERNGKPKSRVVDGMENDLPFWNALGAAKAPAADKIAASTPDNVPLEVKHDMYEISDKTGKIQMKKVEFKKSNLHKDEVFLVDVGNKVFVWVGSGASKEERAKSMSMAVKFIADSGRPTHTPCIRVVQGGENANFNLQFQRD